MLTGIIPEVGNFLGSDFKHLNDFGAFLLDERFEQDRLNVKPLLEALAPRSISTSVKNGGQSIFETAALQIKEEAESLSHRHYLRGMLKNY